MMAIFRTSARRMVFALTGGAAEIVDMGAGRGVGGSPERRRCWAGTKTRNSSTIGVRRVRRNLGRLRCNWGIGAVSERKLSRLHLSGDFGCFCGKCRTAQNPPPRVLGSRCVVPEFWLGAHRERPPI